LLPENKSHIRSVLVKGGGITIILALASLVWFSPVVAGSIVLGGAISLGNIYSIVLVSEALTSAARSGSGRAARAMTAVIYMFKLVLITALLLVLVIYHLVNLFALLAGFTVVLVAHVLIGLGRFTSEPGERA
jgi:ATP synthase I chain